MLNVAVTLRSAVIETLHVGVVPLQAPLQPPNTEPAAGLAVSAALVPAGKSSTQSFGQAMPGPETLPLPPPARVTVSR